MENHLGNTSDCSVNCASGSASEILDCEPPGTPADWSLLRIILNIIKGDWELRAEQLELGILKKYAEIGRFYTWLYLGNCFSAVATVVLMSLTNPILDILVPLNESRIKQPVFEAELPFNNSKHFYWTVLFGASAATNVVTIVVSCESLFAVMTLHACGLFSIVRYRLERITEQFDDRLISRDKNITDSNFQELLYLIEGHIHALK
ncbi:uncharacterized protein LOC117180486 [Belonocnema kinseyi]|uniref:uncharacterized protein LOC117180486 n=1 Tax=Belonocnema kinseyi TaxID=2817044 RepID=UPI00143DC2A5|nr:uncharacterized protein LOC117180486 [Belonocnema kinseyi]